MRLNFRFVCKWVFNFVVIIWMVVGIVIWFYVEMSWFVVEIKLNVEFM